MPQTAEYNSAWLQTGQKPRKSWEPWTPPRLKVPPAEALSGEEQTWMTPSQIAGAEQTNEPCLGKAQPQQPHCAGAELEVEEGQVPQHHMWQDAGRQGKARDTPQPEGSNTKAVQGQEAPDREPLGLCEEGADCKGLREGRPEWGEAPADGSPWQRKSTPFLGMPGQGSAEVTTGAAETEPTSEADLEDAEGEADRRIEEGRSSCTGKRENQQTSNTVTLGQAGASSCTFPKPSGQKAQRLNRQTLPGEKQRNKNTQPERLEALNRTSQAAELQAPVDQRPSTNKT